MHAELDQPKLLALIAAEHAFLVRTLALLTPEQMVTLHTEGDWTPKDMLCHLTRWLNRLNGWAADIRAWSSSRLFRRRAIRGAIWTP